MSSGAHHPVMLSLSPYGVSTDLASRSMTDIEAQTQSSVSTIYTLRKVRTYNPFVHCIVNEAAAAITSNVLLAAGAHPSLTNNPDEINHFIDEANAISINLGMFSRLKFRAAQQAVLRASINRIRWVLDPTMIDRSEQRLKNCLSLIETYPPAVIRGNFTEINTLYEHFVTDPNELSTRMDTVFVITGETDLVISSGHSLELKTGHPWMNSVTGMGCALSALIAAFISVYENIAESTTEILKIYGKAGQLAAERAKGPGSFSSCFIDCLYDESVQ